MTEKSDFIDMIFSEETDGLSEIHLKKYKVLFEVFPLAIIITDNDARIINYNSKAVSLMEVKKEDKGKKISDVWKFYSSSDHVLPPEEYASNMALKHGKVFRNIEKILKKNDNDYIWLSVTASPLPAENYGAIVTYNDITVRRRSQDALKYRMEMEKLITRLSTNFINTGFERAEEELKYTLRETASFVGLDRAYIITLAENLKVKEVYEWYKKGLKGRGRLLKGVYLNGFPWAMEYHRKLIPMKINQVSSLPLEAEAEKKIFEKSGIVSLLSIPLYMRKRLKGILAFAMHEKERIWSDEDMIFLKLLGEIITNFLERKRVEEELHKYREHLEALVFRRTEKLEKEIEDRKKVEDVLRVSENNFRKLSEEYFTLLESIPDMVIVVSPHMSVLWGNKIALSSFLFKDNLENKTCYNLLCKQDKPCKNCPAVKCFKTSEVHYNRVLTPDGKYLDIKANPIIENGKAVKVIIICSDITEKIILEKEATRAAHLASLGELAAGVAHEINNPINSIINCAQIIAGKMDKKSREYSFAEDILSEGDRIAHIVKNLLSFARRPEDIEKKSVNVNEVFSGVMSLAGIQLVKSNISLKMDIPENLPEIFVHSTEIQQVIINILSNSHYALNKKYPASHPDKVIEISAGEVLFDNIPYVELSFKDYGTGIRDDVKNKILEPFYSTKPPGEGTGLGLSIVYGIIENHRGKISIKSSEGEYTKVSVILPVYSQNGIELEL